jgi:hypothetical protein
VSVATLPEGRGESTRASTPHWPTRRRTTTTHAKRVEVPNGRSAPWRTDCARTSRDGATRCRRGPCVAITGTS